MNLAWWAERNGAAPVTAYRSFCAAMLPVPARKVGRLILVEESACEVVIQSRTALYAGVSSADQKADLDRQVVRVTAWATNDEISVEQVLSRWVLRSIGHRHEFVTLLRDPTMARIVLEIRDRFCRFGSEYVEAALGAQDRELVVVDYPRRMTIWCGI